MKRDYQEPLKKWTLFFLSNLASFDGQSFQKLKGSGTRDLLVFRLRNNFTKISLLVILTDQVWWCNTKRFLSYSKYFIYKFMQANHGIRLFHFRLSFWICQVWKGRAKITKLWISLERRTKSFLDEIKNIFQFFMGFHLVKK